MEKQLHKQQRMVSDLHSYAVEKVNGYLSSGWHVVPGSTVYFCKPRTDGGYDLWLNVVIEKN